MTAHLAGPIEYASIGVDTVYRLIAETETEATRHGDDEFWTGWRCALLDLRQRTGRADTDSKIAQLAAAGVICATCDGPLHHTGRCLDCERRAAMPPAYIAAMGYPDADGSPVRTDEQKAICALYNRIENDVYGPPSPEPNSCRWCGVPERIHGSRWTTGRGSHLWDEPTDRQRLDRIHARRAAATFSLWVEVNRRFARALAEGAV